MGNGVSALHNAAMQGDLKALRIAVQEQPSALDAAEPVNGYTALHIAASKGFDAMVRELLARNAAPNIKAKDGRTALHLAAAGGYTDVIQALLRRGGDPGSADRAGKAPLDYAPPGTPAAALLQQALYLGWVPSPGSSPTKAQAAARQQGFPLAAPPLTGATADTLGLPRWPPGPPTAPAASPLGAATAGGTAPAYLAATTDSWLSDLPVPPGGGDAPSAPPPPPTGVPYITPAAAAAGGAGGGAGPAAVPDYYSYIIPAAQREQLLQQKEAERQRAAAATAAAVAAAAGTGGGYYPSLPTPGDRLGAYPGVPSAVLAPPVGAPAAPTPAAAVRSYPLPPLGQAGGAPAAAGAGAGAAAGVGGVAGAGRAPPRRIAEEEDEEDDWGAGAEEEEDDWGDESVSAARRSTGAAAGPSGRPAGPDPFNLASKIGGAMAGAAAAGARMVMTSIMQGGPGGAGGRGGGGGRGAAARREGPPVDEAGATASGPVGRTYTRQQLAAATQGFSPANRIGAGGFGPVYRGVLDGVPVAIKVLDRSSSAMQGEAEFHSEVQILSRLHHPHIVLLLGSCPGECMLVYELLEGGTLEEHLFARGFPPLAWQDRVRIAAEVAAALVFLHSAPTPVVHMDLKPGNILLNKQLTGKLGDVGLSRLVPSLAAAAAAGGGGGGAPMSTVLDTRLVGTPAYMDPEYLRSGRFGPKSDTYSLGIILLQLLTGQPAQRVVGVVEAAIAAWHTNPAALVAVLDPRAGAWPLTEASPLALLALKCAALERSQRPDLREEVLPRLLTLASHAQAAALAAAAAAAGRPGGPVRSNSRRGGTDQPPSEFICPITQDIMEDPVVAADGYTYERDAIAGWLAKSGRSPMTNEALPSSALLPNHTLRSAIKEWLQRHPEAADRRP